MVLMYICICNAITERQVKAAVEGGAHTLSQLQAELGVASCCGTCADTAMDYLPGGQYGSRGTAASQPSGLATLPTEHTTVPAYRAVRASLI